MSQKRGLLEALAQAQNTTVPELIKSALEAKKSIHGAAVELGVFPNTLRHWARQNGYEFVITRTHAFQQIETAHE